MSFTEKQKWAAVAVLGAVVVALLLLIGWQGKERREAAERAREQVAAEERERRSKEAEDLARAREEATEEANRNERELRGALSGGSAEVVVWGDSTGNDLNEWVAQWSQILADDGRSVVMHRWDGDQGGWVDGPVTYGSGGDVVEIWNGHLPGATPGFPLEKGDFPEAADLVLLNFGHNGQPEAVHAEYGALLSRVASEYPEAPVGVIAQNPARGDHQRSSEVNRQVVMRLAAQRRVPVVNVHAAFREEGDLGRLLLDDLHPNAVGSRVWAEAVAGYFEAAGDGE